MFNRTAQRNFGIAALVAGFGLAIGGATAASPAQPHVQDGSHEAAGSRRVEIPVTIPRIRNLNVTSLGRVIEDDSPYAARDCNITSSYTDANFGGGSFTAQAGFGERESFAASYTVPANQWPIKIDRAEMIFATRNASVQTTTRWSISFYQGNPQTGTLIFSEAADDVILPYIRLGPGTEGINLRFSIDSEDPDQIIIADNGSRQFSVAWRVDEHNDQTGNPCFQGPPACCNAFPCTDVSGLFSGANNWLNGLNCGPFGCPPNGGWSRFSNLATACRPTGDIATRVTWSSVGCVPGTGACCLPSGSCEVLSELDCSDREGTYRGEFASCSTANCPAPSGACCLPNGNCLLLSPANCVLVAGEYLGNDSVCASGGLCPRGACCLPNGSCAGNITNNSCIAQGGQFRGVGTTCAASTCPTGRCCLPSGACAIATQIQCTTQSGTWGGAGSSCAGFNCPQPTGACCISGGCIVLTSSNCGLISGSVWAGAFTTCADLNSDGTADACVFEPPCPADYNGDGGVDGPDVEAFFTDWAAAEPRADVNGDGGVDGPDVEYFFIRWSLGGC